MVLIGNSDHGHKKTNFRFLGEWWGGGGGGGGEGRPPIEHTCYCVYFSERGGGGVGEGDELRPETSYRAYMLLRLL